ncbi:NADP-dependent oxidoreductase [Actinomadura rupiterrae]|uniref:NADP-dependent oxidoreductase n=1 Tax=Actinomadura rupiterrae TaxID=559627 RepID=UPI0020A35F3C|nr:NADP-dependent oxidoreductase [Actinomadura rupiterrae]MCP2336836.1 NADPH:quinone reductase-like Zn-dependent oxidoreductase [Actinomadura rupiterrae]
MRAIAVSEFGATPSIMDVGWPEPGPGEVLIKLVAAGMNPFDWKFAAGDFGDMIPAGFPLILGQDGAGVVESVGDGVERFRPGDQVYGSFFGAARGLGSYCEFTLSPQDGQIAMMPQKLVYSQAAAVPMASMTAFNLVDEAGVDEGKTVLVVGATGGVGQQAVQFAALKGAHVIATAGPDMADRMGEFGADETLDYHEVDVADAVLEEHPDGVDVLLDMVNDKRKVDLLSESVKKGGVVASTIGAADVEGLKKRGIKGINFQNRASGELLTTISEMIDTGRLTVHLTREVDLTDVPDVIADAKRGGARGKTVIRV